MNPVWENLFKNQEDAEKIEAAIYRIVAEHCADETSHLGIGESLSSHRASEIIDHAAKSIIAEIIADGAVLNKHITSAQITGKDIRTAENVGSTIDGVLMNSNGIEMWQDGEKTVNIPVVGSPYFKGYIYASGLFYTKTFIITNFETIDSWNKSSAGTISPGLGCVLLQSPNLINGIVGMSNEPIGGRGVGMGDKNPYFQIGGRFWSLTNQLAYFGMGQTIYDGDPHGFGFKVSNGALYGYVYDNFNVEHIYEISGIDVSEMHIYRAELICGEAIRFYVDNVEKYSLQYDVDIFPTSNMPVYFSMYLKTLENATKRITFETLILSEDS